MEFYEYTQRHLRLREYRREYEGLSLEDGKDPEVLYMEMKRLQRQMASLEEAVSEEAHIDKFLQAIQGQYKEEVRVYEATTFNGNPMSVDNLREMIRRSKNLGQEENLHQGTALRCEFCHRTNHNQENCWVKNPALKKAHEKGSRNKNAGTKAHKDKKITCYTYGKTGHMAKDCWSNRNETSEKVLFGLVTTDGRVDQLEHVDSGASRHIAPKPTDFVTGTLKEIKGEQGVKQADGTLLRATHVGMRRILHQNVNLLELKEVYLVPELATKLISVSELTKSGYTVVFSQDKGEIKEKENSVMPLVQLNKAWILPTITLANGAHHATMEAVLLHNRLGHPGGRRLQQAAKHEGIKLKGEIPLLEDCEACLLSKPMRNPVASTSTPSGEITVQVDGLPWKNGLNGQQGAITFTHRKNKVVKFYTYKTKSEAPLILEHYLSQVSQQLNPRATCI